MKSEIKHLAWVDGLKAFALIGILLNHFIESFGSLPWFSYPSYNWPDISIRLANVFPSDGSMLWRLIQFAGWLGDMGPGIFIFVSGFALTFSTLSKSGNGLGISNFYLRRLLRIFPLYIVIHFLIIVLGAVIRSVDFTAPELFLSMLGLRFTDTLFFYINPSWWFIWLIIQLYVIFPFLFKILNRKGIAFFLVVTLTITLLSRSAGLFGLNWSEHLEYWMIGIFAGTRLSEFAAGMILAKIISERKYDFSNLKTSVLLFYGFAIYLSGFICSFFYYTTLFSNTLITLGLVGVLIAIFRLVESHIKFLVNPLVWIGVISFPVFLLHQPLMYMSGNFFTGINKALVQLSVLILVFPAGSYIERTLNQVISFVPKVRDRKITFVIFISVIMQILLNLIYFFTSAYFIFKANTILFVFNIFFIPLIFSFGFKTKNKAMKDLLALWIPVSVIFLFLLTRNWFEIFWIISLFLIGIFIIVSYFTKKTYIRVLIPALLTVIILVSVERWLTINKPVEVLRWGEFPALQKDPVTVYSLIPNRTTHLKYNNYDYEVKANSLGFNEPELQIGEKDSCELRILIIGDAFTMPEGMEYENAYPELLRLLLSARYPDKEVKVFNAGVTGFGPNEMYKQLNKYINIIKPDLYINEVFINEFEEINLDSTARLKSLAFHKFPLRRELFENDQLPKQLSFMLHKLRKDNVFTNYNYYKSLVYFYEKDSNLYTEENIIKLHNYFKNVKKLCDEKNCKVMILYAPGQIEVSAPSDIVYYPYHLPLADTSHFNIDLPNSMFKKICNSVQLPFLDPTQVLISHQPQPVYFTASWHWNQEGHKVISVFLDSEISEHHNFK